MLSRSGDGQQARDHHARALAIAREISAPLEEARALEGLGHCLLRDGNPGDAAAHWQQALTICQRIGAPDAQRIAGNPAPARHHHRSAAAYRRKPSARRTHRAVSQSRAARMRGVSGGVQATSSYTRMITGIAGVLTPQYRSKALEEPSRNLQ